MATLADLQAALNRTNEIIAAERLEVQAKLTELMTQVKALQEQVGAGGGVTPAELDSILASIQSLQAGIAEISEPTA